MSVAGNDSDLSLECRQRGSKASAVGLKCTNDTFQLLAVTALLIAREIMFIPEFVQLKRAVDA